MSVSGSAITEGPGAPDGGSGRSRFTRPAVTLPVVVVLLAAVLAVVLIDRDPGGPGAGEAIVQVNGTARVVRANGVAAAVTGSVRLEPGDRIALRTGTATFELAKGVRYEGRGRAGKAAGTDLEMGLTPSLDAGSLLVTTGAEATALRSSVADVRLNPGAAVRLVRSYAVRLSTYRGEAVLDSAGAQRKVPGLRSADAVGDGELTGLEPIRYDAADRWDRRYLANAVYLDGQLGPLRRGIEAANVPAAALLDAVRTIVVDRPSTTAVDALVGDRGLDVELAIGVAVAGSSRGGVPLARRLDRAFTFHDDGAPWGLVAMDLGADPTSVLAALRRALDGRDVAIALASARSGPSGTVATDGSTASGAAGTTGPGAVGTNPGASATTVSGGGSATGPGGPGGVNVPGVNVPGVSVPGVNVPGVNVPGINVPGITLPGVTVPPINLPPVTVTLPPILVPPLSIPLPGGSTITTPPVTTPPILGPVLGGVNGTVGGLSGAANGATGGLTGTVNGTVGGLGGLLGR